MDRRAFIERLLDDEGLTAGLEDPEARALVAGLVARLERQLAGVADVGAAERCTRKMRERGRKIARLVAALCHQTDPVAARRLWNEMDPAPMPEQMPLADPIALIERLLDVEE